MRDATAKTAKKTANNTAKNTAPKNTPRRADTITQPAEPGTALHRRYGQIGISAVAAAVRYQGGGKNPAYAPVAIRWDDRIEEAA
jgi:hypothetical protein